MVTGHMSYFEILVRNLSFAKSYQWLHWDSVGETWNLREVQLMTNSPGYIRNQRKYVQLCRVTCWKRDRERPHREVSWMMKSLFNGYIDHSYVEYCKRYQCHLVSRRKSCPSQNTNDAKLLNKQSNKRWSQTPWHLCDITEMYCLKTGQSSLSSDNKKNQPYWLHDTDRLHLL